jgi:hypothetical protein
MYPQRISRLKTLARKSDAIDAAVPGPSREIRNESPSLREWLYSDSRKDSRIGWWNSEGAASKAARAEAELDYGKRNPADWVNCRKNDYRENDWILKFNVHGGTSASWMYSDFIVKVASSDKKAYHRLYPYQVVQVHASKNYPSPPFRLDSESRKVIRRAVEEFGEDSFDSLKSAEILPRFRGLLIKHLA